MKSTSARGYGPKHQAERARWQSTINRGVVQCACARADCATHTGRCPMTITGTAWDLGHTDDRRGYTGPECIPCNRAAGARNSNRAQAERKATIVRTWAGASGSPADTNG